MSDLSGNGVVRGFEEYITGYPLPTIKAYALAKTWYALEMPRPGCVWTHTILIPDDAIAEIQCLSDLLYLFRRPARGDSLDHYSRPLHFDISANSIGYKTSSEFRAIMAQLLWSFYGHGGKPVVISSLSSDQFEPVIFALWSQQWPTLRKGFTFCTGALGGRTLAGTPFSMQCAPAATTRDVVLETTATTSAEPILLGALPDSPPKWALRAAADAADSAGGELRRFLWSASDDTTTRLGFDTLVTFFEALGEVQDPAGLITQVTDRFPEASTGGRLKSLLFGQSEQRTWVSFDEAQLLLALGTTENYKALDSNSLALIDRGKELCLQDRGIAKQLLGDLFRSNLNPLGEEMLAGVISALDPETARSVAADQPQFLPVLFRAKPSLAASSRLWMAAGDRKWDLFEAAATNDNLDAEIAGKITAAFLEAGADFLLRRALDKWGKSAVWGALDWLATQGGRLTESCRGPLTFHVQSVMSWLDAHPDLPLEVIMTAAHIVAPYSYEIRQHDASVWLRTFRCLGERANQREMTYLALFLFALGIENAPPEGITLLSESFEIVHEAARRDALGDELWVVVDPVVPHLSWLHDWDKCERLRRGLATAFIRHRWPSSDLKRCVHGKRLFGEVLESARKVEGGKYYFSGVE